MRATALTTAFLCIPVFLQGQITLKQCQDAATAHYPLLEKSAALNEINQYNLLKINDLWNPQIYINAQAGWQSEVTSVPISVPGFEIPELSKDQYKITLDITQTLYDGGTAKRQKEILNNQMAVEQEQAQVDLFSIREKVNQLYFTILTTDARTRILEATKTELTDMLTSAEKALSFGAASNIQILIFRAELLRLDQQFTELRAARNASIAMLQTLTGLTIEEQAIFEIPQPYSISTALLRPELQLFDSRHNLYTAQAEIAEAPQLPKVVLFAQGGYGRPGLNMLVDSFDVFYLGGIRVQYPLWTGTGRKQDAAVYRTYDRINTMYLEQFRQSVGVQSAQLRSEIEKIQLLLIQDDSLIILRNTIYEGAKVQFAEGLISAHELVGYLTDSDAAKASRDLHRLQLTATQIQYQTLMGQL